MASKRNHRDRDPTFTMPTSINGVTRDAWHLRESVERRLFINAMERIKLELILKRLDDGFAGESFIDAPDDELPNFHDPREPN